MKKTLCFSLVFLLALAYGAAAETIRLKDGSTLKGTVVSSDEHNVTLDTEMGQLTISREKIVSIDSSEQEGAEEKAVKSEPGPADSFQSRLQKVDEELKAIEILKSQKDPQWKDRVSAAYQALRKLYYENQGDPQLWYLFAKAFYLNERPKNAMDSIKKAIYFDPAHVDAHILQGDLVIEMSKTKAGDTYSQAIQIYEKALDLPTISSETKSLVYFKIGNAYSHSASEGTRKKAAEFWQKAVETAPESIGAQMAQERLNAGEK